jgi:restriction endonuclease S subunit
MSCSVIVVSPFEVRERHSVAVPFVKLSPLVRVIQTVNDNLEQQAQAIYHERFETVSPNDLPSDWRIVTLGEVATISNKSFNPLKEPEILLEHYSIPAFDEARFPVFELSTSIKSNKFIIDASCFMISKLNPTTKRVWKPYCLTGNAVCSTEFIVYKAKDQSITDFLYSVIGSGSFSDFMCSHVTGSTGSRQRTTPSDTLSYELILPSEDELAEFQPLVSPMYAQMRINAIENDKLKRLRDSLLPKLMSGEIDVSAVQL